MPHQQLPDAARESAAAVCSDVTEELRRERDFIAAVLDTAGSLVIVLDRMGHIVRFNRACELISGYTAAEVLGRHFWDLLLPPENMAAVRASFLQLRAEDFPQALEYVWVVRDGSRRRIAWSNTALRDDLGRIEYVIGTGIDITGHNQIEEALHQSEGRYRSLVESAKDAIFTLATDGTITSLNSAFEAITGWPRDQWLGASIAPLVIEEDLPDAIAVMRRVLVGETPDVFELRICSRSGALVSGECTLTPQLQQGQVVGVLGIARDITERKRAQQALRDTEIQFRTLVEQLPAITYVAALDAASSTIYTSPQIEMFLGFSQAEWMADHQLWLKQIHPDDQERVRAELERSQATGVPIPSEYRMLTRDGRVRWFRDQAVIVRNDDGQPLFLQGFMFDITERQQAEAALRASEARNRALIDAIPDLMFQMDRDGVYRDYKAEHAFDLAMPPEMFLGRQVFDVLPDGLARRTMDSIECALRTGAPQIFEYQLLLGQDVHDYEARVVVSGEDEVLAIVRDITQRKNVERMKNEFISMVSHELRTPLTSIRGSLGLIAGGVAGDLPAPARAMVDIAYKNSERLVRLINDILDIEKIESGTMTFHLKPVELLPLVEQTIEANRSYGLQYRVSFRLANQTAGVKVNADSDRLTQALTNLLSNAAKFSPPDDTVEIVVSRHTGGVRIAVHDHGFGIPAEFRERIFQKFAQADSSSTRQKGGTGLGLSITKAIVEKLGGQITFESRLGSGTSFFLDLPEWRDSPAVLRSGAA
jgi:PAS domain S-box-containing protein